MPNAEHPGRIVARAEGLTAIDRSFPTPLHAQFRYLLLGMIERGEVRPGIAMPSERDLAARYRVSLAPVRQAYLDLVREGLLYRVRGQGTFLREPRVVERISVLSSFAESMRASGHHVAIRVLRLATEPITPDAAAALRTRERDVLVLDRLGVVDGEPMAVLSASLPRKRFAALMRLDFERVSLYQALHDQFGVTPVRASTVIDLAPCGSAMAAELLVQPGTPLLRVHGSSYDVADEPVEYFVVHYRADRCQLALDSFRSDEAVVRPLSGRRQRPGLARSPAAQQHPAAGKRPVRNSG